VSGSEFPQCALGRSVDEVSNGLADDLVALGFALPSVYKGFLLARPMLAEDVPFRPLDPWPWAEFFQGVAVPVA